MRNYKFYLEYYQFVRKKNTRKTMIGMNWYFSANHFEIDRIKKLYHKSVLEKLEFCEGDKLEKYKIKYKLYYKKDNQDLMNVVSVMDKFIQDGLQHAGLINDDNVKNCVKISAVAVEKDKQNPRLEVEIIEV